MPSGCAESNEAGPTEECGSKGETRHFRAHCGDHKGEKTQVVRARLEKTTRVNPGVCLQR